MARGEYAVQDVEASKQAGRDSSYKTCVVTILIFFLLSIILILLAWRLRPEPRGYYRDSYSKSQYNQDDQPFTTKSSIRYAPTTEFMIKTESTVPKTSSITTMRTITTTTTSAPTRTRTSSTTAIPTSTTAITPTTETFPSKTSIPKSTSAVFLIPLSETSSSSTASIPTTVSIAVMPNSTFSTTSTSGPAKNLTEITTSSLLATSPSTTTTTEHMKVFIPIPITSSESVQEFSTSTTSSSLDTTEYDTNNTYDNSVDTSYSTSTTTAETTSDVHSVHIIPEITLANTTVETTSEMIQTTNPSIGNTSGDDISTSDDYGTTLSDEDSSEFSSNILTVTESTSTSNKTTDFNATSETITVTFTPSTSTLIFGSTVPALDATSSDESGSTENYAESTQTSSGPKTVPVNTLNTTEVTATTESSTATTDINVAHRAFILPESYSTDNTEAENTSSSTVTVSSPQNVSISPETTTTELSITNTQSTTSLSDTPSTSVSSTVTSSTDTPVPTVATTSIQPLITTAETTIYKSAFVTETSTNTSDSFLLLSTTPSSGLNITDKDNVCISSECKILTSRILSLMNHSMDPCDNFYEYACGGLRSNRALLPNDPEVDVWEIIDSAVKNINDKSNPIFKRFRFFYDQCVDYEKTVNRSERLRLARNVIEGVDKIYNEVEWQTARLSYSLTDILIKLFRLNSAPLFDVVLDVNGKDPSKYQLMLTLPNLHSKLQLEPPGVKRCKEQIVSDDPHNFNMKLIYDQKYRTCIRNFTIYLETLEKAVRELELYGNTDPHNVSINIGDIRFFLHLHILAEVVELDGRTDIANKKFTWMKIKELQEKYQQVEWLKLFNTLFYASLEEDTEVQVYFDDYLDKIFEALEREAANTSAWLIIHNALLAMLAHDLYVDLVEPRPCDREEYCLRIASGLMEDVSSSIYLNTFTKEDLYTKEHELKTLFEQLKNTTTEHIVQANWLDEESKSALVNKLQNMRLVADGGLAMLNDSSYLANQLSTNDLKPTNNYFENAVQLTRRYRSLIFYLFEQDPSAPENIWSFFRLPYDTHAYAVYQMNIVIIPYGMTQSWKSTKNIPSYIFKTHIGTEIARQMVHHFDPTGITYGTNGLDPDLLSIDSKDVYNYYEICENNLHDYNTSWTNQYLQNYNFKIDAKRSMNEHITDNSALYLMYKLFTKTAKSEPLLPWLDIDHEKLYFLLAAQEFCTKADMLDYTVSMFESEQMPLYLRVDNMINHSQNFGGIYKCPLGGKQNPQYKCYPFPEIEEDSPIGYEPV